MSTSICYEMFRKATKPTGLTREQTQDAFNELKDQANQKMRDNLAKKADAYNTTVDDLLKKQKAKLEHKKRQSYLDLLKKKYNLDYRMGDKYVETVTKDANGKEVKTVTLERGFKGKQRLEELEAIISGKQKYRPNGKMSADLMGKVKVAESASDLHNALSADDNAGYNLLDSKESVDELANEMFKKGTSKDAKVASSAEGIKGVYNRLAKLMNRHGASISLLDEFMANQTHDRIKLSRVGDNYGQHIAERWKLMAKFKGSFAKTRDALYEMAYDRWKNKLLPLLDHERTFKGSDVEKFMRGAYDGLRSGLHYKPYSEEINPSYTSFRKSSNRADRLSMERKFHFKDGRSFNEYNTDYGTGDLRSAIWHTIEKSSKELGLMQQLGTNPRNMLENAIKDLEETFDRKDLPRYKGRIQMLRNTFDHLDGSANIPVNTALANAAAGLRTWASFTKLGGVVLSSFPDMATSAAAMRDNGVGMLDGTAELFKTFAKSSADKNEIGILTGVFSEATMSDVASRMSTFDARSGLLSKGIQKFFKINGMYSWDRNMRVGLGSVVGKQLARWRGLEHSALEDLPKTVLKGYGIDESEWNLIRKLNTTARKGDNYIFPDSTNFLKDADLARYAKENELTGARARPDAIKADMRDRLYSYFIDQADNALIQPSAYEKAIITRGTKAGTIPGELMRFAGHFKSFTTGFTRRVLGRYYANNDIGGLASIMLASTVLGYGSMAAKDLAKGIVPRNPQSVSTWGAAMLQGGGLGIYGDFLFGEYDRFGKSFLADLAGPEMGMINDAATLIAKIRDQEHAGNAAFHFATNNMPLLNLFYTRAALNYLLLFGIQNQISSGYFDRMKSRLKENEQKFILDPEQYSVFK